MAPLRPELPALLTRLAESLPSNVLEDIRRCSVKRRTGITLNQMMTFQPIVEEPASTFPKHPWRAREQLEWEQLQQAQSEKGVSVSLAGATASVHYLISAARFLHNELPIRFAHRIAELDHLPHGLSDMPHVIKVQDWYVRSFMELRSFPKVQTEENEKSFTNLIAQIRTRHNNTLPNMARGLAELKHKLKVDQPWLPMEDYPEVHHFLDRFFMSRIGIRMLIGQHLALHQQKYSPRTEGCSMIGLIDTKCSPVELAHRAIQDATALCISTYGTAPKVDVFGDESFTFPYVPRHVHLMLLELLKNSLRAVHERFANMPANQAPAPKVYQTSDGRTRAPPAFEAPPIRIVIADGLEDVTIKVCDEGGGISRSGLPRIWSYLYSTAQMPQETLNPPSVEVLSERDASAGAVGGEERRSDAADAAGAAGAAGAAEDVPLDREGEGARQANSKGARDTQSDGGNGAAEASPGSSKVAIRTDRGDEARFLAGYGDGLPISRLYARYFGGDLQIYSMEGYGTDAYLHLNRLRNVQEPLP